MFTKHKIYYTVETKLEEEDTYIFVCSFSTYSEAIDKADELRKQTGNEYRVLKIEKDKEEVS